MGLVDAPRLLNWFSVLASFATAVAALGAAWHWREASKVAVTLDPMWENAIGDIPDFTWIYATMQAIERSGALNSKAVSWAAASALLAAFAAAAAAISLWLAGSVQSRVLVDWIEFESLWFDCPSFADELVGVSPLRVFSLRPKL
jgi:hypothetical protein